MNKEILKYPNKILRKKSEEVTEITDEIKKITQNITRIMEAGNGIGLAAPQIGILKRIIVVRTADGPKVFLNPEIISESKETEIGEEGCLSFPGLYLKIKRAKEVEITALDINGKEIRIKAKGFVARIFQHEINHLDGILFIDKISFWQKLKLKL